MEKRVILAAVVGLFLLSGCKSEFEKIRASGDVELIHRKAREYFEQGEYQRAQTLYELVIPAYRGKRELEDVYFQYAYTFYHQGKYILANYYFKNFATTFPNSTHREEAEFMAAYSYYHLSPSFRLDQSYTEKAIEEFQLFVNMYPHSERVQECNRLIDEMRLKLEQKAFAEAMLYYDLRQYQAAVVTFENLLKDFPETRKAEQVRFMIVKSAYELARNSIYTKQEERYKEVVEYADYYLRKFADGKNQKEVAAILDGSIQKLKSLTNGKYRYQDQSTGVGS
ncbi:MAG: outer membrane protein assembly factor BamD [Bacteroidetes bacterium]|nr:MAG: outer membrane protein assembly factor BamD [Bacteroidota bacterium]